MSELRVYVTGHVSHLCSTLLREHAGLREAGVKIELRMLEKDSCHAVLNQGDGSDEEEHEIDCARDCGRPVFDSIADLLVWADVMRRQLPLLPEDRR